MTRQDFILRTDLKKRLETRSFVVPLILIVVLALTYLPCLTAAQDLIARRVSGTFAEVIAVLPVAGPLLGFLALVVPMARSIDRRCGVSCRHCGRSLDGPRGIVIASGRCPRCGERVLCDDDQRPHHTRNDSHHRRRLTSRAAVRG
ncbi:MAG: hypothetical protein GY715_04590 [Planctomycetes bacterium]|nr:hypothetical protein [Planctomycetota bacterium]